MQKYVLLAILTIATLCVVKLACADYGPRVHLLELDIGNNRYLVFPGITRLSEGNYIRFCHIGHQITPYVLIDTKEQEYLADIKITEGKSNLHGMIAIPESVNYRDILGLRINGHHFEWQPDN
ncbi:MAG: hypothetical protein WBQ78_15645 [Gammaproteobacteria bacterium]